jgi:DNA-directed RNA polymerase specialized sigma24 family protein
MKPRSESGGVGPANQKQELDAQFARCIASLRLVAGRVLRGDDDVEEAMRRSYLAAANTRQRLENDGEFRRWLVRTVLNQALMILHEKEGGAVNSGDRVFWQVC